MSSPTPNLNILISGCGIAGTVLSYWLLRANPNTKITIVERDPSLRLTGASVDIRSSAVDIIKWMGVEPEIRRQSTLEEGMQLVDVNDKLIATMRATGRSDVQSMTSEYEIFRGELAKIFLEPIKDKVKLVFGETIESYEEGDEGVTVTFTKSKETKTYDLLVGADGLYSKIRGKMMGTHPQEQVYDEGVHVAYFTIKHDMLKGSRLAKGYSDTGGRVLYLRPDPHPEGRTRALLMNVTTHGDVETKDKLNKAIREGNESYMKLLEDEFKDIGWLVPETLKGMRESDDFYCSLFGQTRSPRLQDKRVVLLGDAGYATPGFGTSLAIIGGYVLAGELLNNAGDIDSALKAYEDILQPFVKDSQGGVIGEYAMQMANPQTRTGIRIRNTIFWFVTWSKLDQFAMAAAAKLGFTEKKVPMPDYPWPTT